MEPIHQDQLYENQNEAHSRKLANVIFRRKKEIKLETISEKKYPPYCKCTLSISVRLFPCTVNSEYE